MNHQKTEWLGGLIDKIHLLPINEVIEDYMELVPRGPHFMGLCPFHPDTSLGSFVVTPSKGLWHCFTDGIGGDAIRFVIFYHHKEMTDAFIKTHKTDHTYASYMVDAILEIAIGHGLITPEEYQMQSRRRYAPSQIKHLAKKTEEPKFQAVSKKAPDNVIRAVYNHMPKACGLNKKDLEHLKRVRRLPDDRLSDFFSFPDGRTDLPRNIARELSDHAAENLFHKRVNQLDEKEKLYLAKCLQIFQDEFHNIPGFYYDERAQKLTFSKGRGIGFVVRDVDGNPVGITVRRHTVAKGEARYKWFSSSFALSTPGLSGGASPGAPGGVLYPKDRDHAQVVVTEGRFKAEAIAAKGNIAVYVSGVSSWKSVMGYLKKLGRKKVYIAFDADMPGNAAVHNSLSSFCEALLADGMQPVLILWSKAKGKGFDDLVINVGNRYVKELTYMPYHEFEVIYQGTLKSVLKEFSVQSIRDIPVKDRDAFNNALQTAIEKKTKPASYDMLPPSRT